MTCIFILLLKQLHWLGRVGRAETRVDYDTPSGCERMPFTQDSPVQHRTDLSCRKMLSLAIQNQSVTLQRDLYFYTSKIKCIICLKATGNCHF